MHTSFNGMKKTQPSGKVISAKEAEKLIADALEMGKEVHNPDYAPGPSTEPTSTETARANSSRKSESRSRVGAANKDSINETGEKLNTAPRSAANV